VTVALVVLMNSSSGISSLTSTYPPPRNSIGDVTETIRSQMINGILVIIPNGDTALCLILIGNNKSHNNCNNRNNNNVSNNIHNIIAVMS